ncbi:hypothetical protein N0V82_000136 [Gnomoniopsis sp. IMI 355080]|nr:hypothetical protein N0V82_000136 [Gnomoniopsis sp. IMI 355080]
MGSTKNVVILGASYGGLSTAHYLLRHVIPRLPTQETYQIILINPSREVFCRPACPRAMLSDDMFEPNRLFVNINSTQLQKHGAENLRLVWGKATDLDHNGRHVTVLQHDGTMETVSFHALVIATGATTPSPLLGLSLDVKFLKDCWQTFRNFLSYSKRIVIAGGGPSGVEAAGELGEYLNGRAGFFTPRQSTRKAGITLITSGRQILPDLRPSIAAKAEHYLSRLGVTLVKNARVKSVTPEGAGQDPRLLISESVVLLEDGRSFEADLFIPATGPTPNTSFIRDKSLLSAGGYIDTNPKTLRVDRAGERIYAIGDVSNYARPAIHNILEAVPVLCANMKRDLLLAAGQNDSRGQDAVFCEDTRETQFVPIGKGKGVGMAVGWQVPSFFVWLIKGRDYWLWTTEKLWSGKKWAKERGQKELPRTKEEVIE